MTGRERIDHPAPVVAGLGLLGWSSASTIFRGMVGVEGALGLAALAIFFSIPPLRGRRRKFLEYSTVAGQFCGRSRKWLRDGTLVTDEVLLFNREVTPAQYRRAAAQDPRLPQLLADFRKVKDRRSTTEKRNYRLFTSWLLAKPNCSEMRTWLNTEVQTKRTLGRFKQAAAAVAFGEKLYQAGAAEVLAADIYHNKQGDQFADCLLVQLPKAAGPRDAIRKVCAQLQRDDLGAFLPDQDWGESHLYISAGV